MTLMVRASGKAGLVEKVVFRRFHGVFCQDLFQHTQPIGSGGDEREGDDRLP
jgi:hypothetical protein